MTVKALKLVNGEELVVEITEETETELTFKNPALGFRPWMQAADGPFTIGKDKLITQGEVANEVKNGYNEIFGAGIVVPPKQLITG
jgi:hypothetical protein